MPLQAIKKRTVPSKMWYGKKPNKTSPDLNKTPWLTPIHWATDTPSIWSLSPNFWSNLSLPDLLSLHCGDLSPKIAWPLLLQQFKGLLRNVIPSAKYLAVCYEADDSNKWFDKLKLMTRPNSHRLCRNWKKWGNFIFWNRLGGCFALCCLKACPELKVLLQKLHGILIPSKWFTSMWSFIALPLLFFPHTLQMYALRCPKHSFSDI